MFPLLSRFFRLRHLLLVLVLLFFPQQLWKWFGEMVVQIVSQREVEKEVGEMALLENLLLENQLLKEELSQLALLFRQSNYLKEEALEPLLRLRYEGDGASFSLKELRMRATPAKIIYRSQNDWHRFFWINLGKRDHPSILINSPVVEGKKLLGVIDYVGEKSSRVRLIGEGKSIVAVRAWRSEDLLKKNTLDDADRLLKSLIAQQNMVNTRLYSSLVQGLEELCEEIASDVRIFVPLAKGEIEAVVQPPPRRGGAILLRGIGFNYDFGDEFGPPRELCTGQPIGYRDEPAIPLLQEGDLLLTSGMDGIYPSGLEVGTVVGLSPFKEGDYYYDIEAICSTENFDTISDVLVLPAIEGIPPI